MALGGIRDPGNNPWSWEEFMTLGTIHDTVRIMVGAFLDRRRMRFSLCPAKSRITPSLRDPKSVPIVGGPGRRQKEQID